MSAVQPCLRVIERCRERGQSHGHSENCRGVSMDGGPVCGGLILFGALVGVQRMGSGRGCERHSGAGTGVGPRMGARGWEA